MSGHDPYNGKFHFWELAIGFAVGFIMGLLAGLNVIH
jgi:hypothetical protein